MSTDTETDVDETVDDRPDEAEPVVEAAAYDRLARNVFFTGNDLVIEDRDLIETRLVRQRWSPSSALSLNDGCPSKWAIEKLLPRSADPLGAAELGTAGHWVLETMFGMPALERTLEAAIAIIESITPEKNTDLAVPAEPGPRFMWGAEVLGKIAGLWQTEDPTKVVAIGRETQLDNVSIGGVPFNGIVDRTDLVTTLDGRTGLGIRDYKTGKVPRDRVKGMHHTDQGRMYHLAYTDLHNTEPVAGSIIYTGFGVVTEIDTPAAELDRVKAMFVDTFEKATVRAETGHFNTVFSGLCGWCPLTTVCPTAKAGGRNSARVPGAKAGTEIGIRVLPAIMATRAVDPDLIIPVTDVPPIDPQYDPEPPPDIHVDPLPPVDAQYDPEPPPDPYADTESVPVEVDDFGTPILASGPTSLMAETESRKELEMADNNRWSGGESKVWELTNPDGSPNPNSAAAGGIFGLIDLASKQIELAGFKPRGKTVLAVSQTLMYCVDKAMRDVTNTATAGLNDGLHGRLRGALYSFVESKPLPVGQPVEVWDVWTEEAITRLKGFANIGFRLMTVGIPERPWALDDNAELLSPAAPVAVPVPAAAA